MPTTTRAWRLGGGSLAAIALALIAAATAIALVLEPGGSTKIAPGKTGRRVAWAPPALRNPTTIDVTPSHRLLTLDPHRDYRIELPQNKPLTGRGGLAIVGGHNVVLIGGEIAIGRQGRKASIDDRRGLLLKNQTGTMHVEGLLLAGAGLAEGIDLDQRAGATVQLENIRVAGLHARDERNFTDNHPDVVQTWAGPARLRIDRLTGRTDYQGFFLNPQQFLRRRPRIMDLRHVNIVGTRTARYLLWQATPFRKSLTDVWIAPARGRPPDTTLWPNPAKWPGVRVGTPPGGDFVPANAVGVGYRPATGH